jgi:uncharacterized protein (TIGR02391 family)
MATAFGRDLDELERLSVDQLALAILGTLTTNYGGTVNWSNWRSQCRMHLSKTGADDGQITDFLVRCGAAWQWLRNETLLAPHYEQDAAAGWEAVTELAATAERGGLADARTVRMLRNADLDEALAETAMKVFSQGLYSAAVFQAMLEVEVRVRAASGLEIDGVSLAKQAFKTGGPLSDPNQPPGDQDAEMALFWGAIGVFRNQAGHNQSLPEGDPQEAAEAILLANALLRIVGRRLRDLRPA